MTKEEYFKFHQEFCEKMMQITASKNKDYTGANADPFANFTAVGDEWTAIGFYTRMTDKMSRIKSFIQKGELEHESVADSLRDLANYSVLFAGYLKSKSNEKILSDMIKIQQ